MKLSWDSIKDDGIIGKVNKGPFLYPSSPVFCCVGVYLGVEGEVGTYSVEDQLLLIQFHLTILKSVCFDLETP